MTVVAAAARRWIAAVTIGEAAGFAVATGAAVTGIVLGLPPVTLFAIGIAAGLVEGALLATGQLRGMAGSRPPPARWVLATSLAAGAAWAIGLTPSTWGLDLFTPFGFVLIGVGGLVLLATIPVAQRLVMGRRPGSRSWVPVNMCAWAVAILWTFAPSPLVDERSPVGLVVALYVVAGLLMAVTIAALTAPLASRMFASDEATTPSRGARGRSASS